MLNQLILKLFIYSKNNQCSLTTMFTRSIIYRIIGEHSLNQFTKIIFILQQNSRN